MLTLLKLLIRILLVAVFAFGLVSIWESFRTGRWFSVFFGETVTTQQHNVVLKEIQTLGKLELVKYNFKDVVEKEMVRSFLPNAKVILIVHGEATGCIDLTKVVVADLNKTKDTLVVHLPEPEICYYKIDHSKSKVYNTEFALLEEANLVQDAYKQAETQIQKSALDMGVLEQTKQNAEKILKPFLEKVANQKVVLRYRMKATLPEKK